ncbi:hypothetical protein PUNSTDRAFT_42073 [Punctularia strigosozonata HHB-11173 SS5]|uniref:uncharacterized protein n=1 Tax=Punctularia strigosozonata (strain HHB-11173) TaxID=741275 RepID=UPI0004417D01|nr:uncharacterized protein PUNSTDRAFT_42073 [Punctularia strigosozonata HHB-11173 SS5]EIN12461.1 hypothetical protein PUNSTDRAFT_42073 [Punctularia strigosozonata HHB-11173 SS5]
MAQREVNWLGAMEDDSSTKTVKIATQGSQPASQESNRHVFMFWEKGRLPHNGDLVYEILHLVGPPRGLRFEHIAKSGGDDFKQRHQVAELGDFTRAQRDQIRTLAAKLPFNPVSAVNDCRAWLHDLINAMVEDSVVRLSPAKRQAALSKCHLPARMPE